MTTPREYRLEGTLVLLSIRARQALNGIRAGDLADDETIRLEVAVRIAESLLAELELEHLAQDIAEAGLTLDRRPHSRACGVTPHLHGQWCAPDCPTCHARIGREPIFDDRATD